MHTQICDWHDPMKVARFINHHYKDDFVFLHSSIAIDSGFSVIGYNLKNSIISSSFADFERVLSKDQSKFSNSWFGYLGYELRCDIELSTLSENSFIKMPRLWMNNFSNIIIFDFAKKQCQLFSDSKEDLCIPGIQSTVVHNVKIEDIRSNMTKSAYCDNVQKMLDAIYNGDFYEANLTRKFYGELSPDFDKFEIFADLCKISPAKYSAFLRLQEYSIISSSPEQFLQMNAEGLVNTCPIKGSAPRFSDKAKDHESRVMLENSAKDKAENLMIVDLMRNDFARGSIVGSVKISDLFHVTTHATIHHMSSKITAQKLPDLSSIEFVKNCFPPGSMTGAPKIKVMECCDQLENWQRGVYSGGLGWFGGDGSLELSVVIRTLILSGNKFEFQVGGAIVADSTPMGEWNETVAKAQGICKTLNIDARESLS